MLLFVFAASVLLIPAIAAPTRIPITKHAGPIKPNSYVVKLKDGVSQDLHIAQLVESARTRSHRIKYKYEVIQGYAGIFNSATLDLIRKSSDVESIQADTIHQLHYFQGNASQEIRARSEHEDSLRYTAEGKGVTIFALDTGIFTSHECFGGRASWGATFGEGYKDIDDTGHGTHVAGLAVGTRYGIATAARVIAVKLCSANECAVTDVIAGVNYAVMHARGPTVVTMSINTPVYSALDSAVSNGIAKGIHFTVSAGNDGVDAANTSPARVQAANTVGAIDRWDEKAIFSNYGAPIDVWAPGVDVLSAGKDTDTATERLSGTSMSTPQIAGILAVALSEHGSMPPANLSMSLKSHAKGVVTGVPKGTSNLKAQLW